MEACSVSEEVLSHGDGPADPTWCEVTGDNKLAIVATDDHKGRSQPQSLSLGREDIIWQLHDQKDLDEQQWDSEQPVHVSVCIIEWHACELWCLNE